MIIAILEDSKGFRASYNFAKFLPRIDIPIHPKLTAFYCEDSIPNEPPTIKKMTFSFYKWLEKNKVALYRESL